MKLYCVLLIGAACAWAEADVSTESTGTTAGYRFRYFVRDDRTGDLKGQTEVRQGDDVQGSYALKEPNGDMRIVSYTAGKDTGFKARVQVHPRDPPLPPLPTNEPDLSHLMRIPPRNIYRTGFQHVEIKVVPPSTTEVPQVTQKPPFTPEEEQLLRGQDPPSPGYSEQNYEVFNSPSDINKGEAGTTAIHHDQISSSEASFRVNSTSDAELCPPCDKNEEEGRARIKQEGDQVQLEMEQVIRTEMKDPDSVKMGTPYQSNKHTLPRPDNSGIPPLPFTPFRPDIMTPVYMKPLYLRSNSPNAPQWPPIVNSGDRLYIPHIVVENEDVPPEIFPSKVYLVPIPRPLTLGQEDLMSLAYPWEGKTPIPKEELSGPYKPNRPKPHPSFTYPPTYTYLLFPKDLRGK